MMTLAQFGLVLAKMAEYLGERVKHRREYLGPQNTELAYALCFTLSTGAQACVDIYEESKRDQAS